MSHFGFKGRILLLIEPQFLRPQQHPLVDINIDEEPNSLSQKYDMSCSQAAEDICKTRLYHIYDFGMILRPFNAYYVISSEVSSPLCSLKNR